MSETIPILGDDDRMIIKKKGIVDFEQMYADIRKWYLEKKYEFQETDHKYKANNPLGEEHELVLYGWRKENDFIKWETWVYMNIWDLIPVMVTVNGHKKRMYQGRFKIWFVPKFIMDFGDYFEKTKFLRHLRKFYINNIIRYKWQAEADKFEYEFHELHELIKKDMDMWASGNQFAHMWK